MYDFSYVEEKLLFPLFCCTETPVCCDAIDRLGCLVASFALIRNVGFVYWSAFAFEICR